jgi:hypothetical protein
MIPNLSPAALSIGLGAGQPGFGQRPEDDEEEIARKKKLLASANAWTGQPLSPAALSLNLGQNT